MSTIVYTAILGDCDSLKPAPTGFARCVCFVDAPIADPKGWELRPISYGEVPNPRRMAWRLRCVPHDLFPDYQRVVWIDASFTLTDLPKLLADAGTAPIAALRHHERNDPYWEARRLVKIGQGDTQSLMRQVDTYTKAGFRPQHLSISCVVVRDRSDAVRKFNQTWLDEIDRYPGDNTQVSLDYSAWANGMTIKALQGTRHANPYACHDAADHELRRKPYDTAVTR